jgi:hypothetical protein
VAPLFEDEESEDEHELAIAPAVVATASNRRRRTMGDVLSLAEGLAGSSTGQWAHRV